MSPLLEEILNTNIKDYEKLHEAGAFPEKAHVPSRMRNVCISAIDARIEALVSENKMEDPEYEECTFISTVLKNGWLVSDINMLRHIYASVKEKIPGQKDYVNGMKLISELTLNKADTVEKRFEFMGLMSRYFRNLDWKTETTEKTKNEVAKNFTYRVIYQSEYPGDTIYDEFGAIEDGVAKIAFAKFLRENDKHIALTDKRYKNAREKSDYVFKELTDFELLMSRQEYFQANPGQAHNKITKTNKNVIEEVFGSDIYDEIDDMKKGSYEERKVPLIHSQGNKLMKQGYDVLEMEFAGSGAQDIMKYHKERDGEVKTTGMSPQDIERKYGNQVKKKDGTYFSYLRSQEASVEAPDGRTVEKKKYFIAGATPDIKLIGGLFNLGEYSIESTRTYARDFASEFLEKHFKKWLDGTEQPHDIHINLSGHSRGAVAAGEAIKKINEWVKNYAETHEGAKDIAKYIHYDLRLYDPVPGFITNFRLGSVDLRDVPNLNTTVVCSMAQDHYDLLFPLQHVKGAKKLILTTTDHLMDLWKEDKSQQNIYSDGRKHAVGFYDAETGEMYRGSGIGQMPDGIYISDEKQNVVRITSYSQVGKIYKSLYGKESPQRIRTNHIHRMIRDWFIENHLEMSFPDPKTRIEQSYAAENVMDRILNSPNKRIAPVQEEIRALRVLKDDDPSNEALIAQNKKIIEVCRAYMKKTSIPASGDSEYRMDLVSDLLTFTMKENNQLEKELAIEKGEVRDNTLDDKIKTHQERLRNKEGFLDRKLEEEKKRLSYENRILDYAKRTAKLCNEQLELLDKTRVGKSNSDEYNKLHAVLEAGTKLGENSSIRDIIEFQKKLTKVGDKYVSTHDRVIGPRTDDGKTRLNSAKTLSKFGKKIGKEVEEAALKLGDKDILIGQRIASRKESIEDIGDTIERQKAEKLSQKAKKVEEAKKKVEAKKKEGPKKGL